MARDASFTLQELLNLALENGIAPSAGLVTQNGPLLEDSKARLGFHQLFHNADLDSGDLPEDLIPWGGTYTFPTTPIAAADIDIVSASAEDGAGTGTGASQLKLIGLDADWKWQEEVIALNGMTPVHPTKAYLRFNRMEIVGPTGSVGTNVGAISLTDGVTQYSAIAALGGISHVGVFTIPADYSGANLLGAYFHLAGGAAGNWGRGYINVRWPGHGWWNWYHWTAVQNQRGIVEPFIEKFLPAKTDIRLTCVGVAVDDLRVDGRFELRFIP